jgi:hypothetical protein
VYCHSCVFPFVIFLLHFSPFDLSMNLDIFILSFLPVLFFLF